jgi:hypothetical protein
MAGYKGRIQSKAIERHYPHIVELMVPLKGFGPKLHDMHALHTTRGIQSQRGSGRYHEGRHYVRWCFGGPEECEGISR